MQILQKVVDLRTVNCSEKLAVLTFCSWLFLPLSALSLQSLLLLVEMLSNSSLGFNCGDAARRLRYINITTGLNKFGRRFVYIQTIYKQASLARHIKRAQRICRAEDYTSNYIFFKRGTSRVQYRPKNGRINDAAATGSSAAPFSHHTGDMERRRL